jgi:chromosome segregation ATPase
MLHKLATGVVASLVLMAGLPVVIMAQEDTSVSNENTTMTTQIEQTSDEVTPSTQPESREARIKELKDKATAKISATEERRIASRCTSAQSKVSNLQTRLNKVVESRQEKYTNLTSKFTELSEKLKAAGVDTTELDAAIAELDVNIASSLETINTYNKSLADLAEMDCEDDPSGFKLTLDAARKQRSEVIAMQGTLKSSINDSIRPLLQNIRTTLEANSNNQESGE